MPGTQKCMGAGPCPQGDHRLTREQGKWPKLGEGLEEPREPLLRGLLKDKELLILATRHV